MLLLSIHRASLICAIRLRVQQRAAKHAALLLQQDDETPRSKQTAEIDQMQVETRSVDRPATQHRASRCARGRVHEAPPSQQYHHCTRSYLRGRVHIFNIASCAFKSFASATMALNNEDVKKELVVTKESPIIFCSRGFLTTTNQARRQAILRCCASMSRIRVSRS